MRWRSRSRISSPASSARSRPPGRSGWRRCPTCRSAKDTLPNFEVVNWYGMVVRAGTPAEIVARLSQEVAHALRQPDVAERAASLGLDLVGTTPAQFAEFQRDGDREVGRGDPHRQDSGRVGERNGERQLRTTAGKFSRKMLGDAWARRGLRDRNDCNRGIRDEGDQPVLWARDGHAFASARASIPKLACFEDDVDDGLSRKIAPGRIPRSPACARSRRSCQRMT